ncbi:FecR family protein [Trichloromonas sp.]|uniref:FecR family protein n=1 Tax=Trichloromonas sp. TaxID=3069249 RepID=UPI002A3C446F|nr:FecR domain-containing protein [Trichloromonas sp.]
MKRFCIFLLVMVFCPSFVQAQDERIGSIKNVEGQVFVLRGGETLAAEAGTLLYRGDQLKTGESGRVGVIFRDDTRLSLGGNSDLAVEQFEFAPGEGRLALVLRLARGMAAFVSGQISKLAPESVRLETPVGTVGVRGTHFVMNIVG